jgi:hypothetical protein
MRSGIVVLCSVASVSLLTSPALAQSWSLGRERPALFEIIATDASADKAWPFEQEDVAGDGVATLQADEAAVDLRTVYADVRANRLWLRAYVAAKTAPTSNALAFFFIDTDARTNTGAKADDTKLWSGLTADPTPGGYERAVGMRGDGTLLGVYVWDAQKSTWEKQPDKPMLATLEVGVGRDPIRIAGDDHGYFQVELDLAASGLDAACEGTIFVRLKNDGDPKRNFGDDLGMDAAACRAQLNAFGDPTPLHSDACSSDASCPAQGVCRQGTCLFGYECSADTGCRTDEHCSAGTCVRVVEKSCQQDRDCDGLVCDAGRCTTCSATGARACESGLLCAPAGSCISPRAGAGGNKAVPAAGSGATDGERVRGGAFVCAATPGRDAAPIPWLWLAACVAFIRCVRRSRLRGGKP